jgi:hypothetical protein
MNERQSSVTNHDKRYATNSTAQAATNTTTGPAARSIADSHPRTRTQRKPAEQLALAFYPPGRPPALHRRDCHRGRAREPNASIHDQERASNLKSAMPL